MLYVLFFFPKLDCRVPQVRSCSYFRTPKAPCVGGGHGTAQCQGPHGHTCLRPWIARSDGGGVVSRRCCQHGGSSVRHTLLQRLAPDSDDSSLCAYRDPAGSWQKQSYRTHFLPPSLWEIVSGPPHDTGILGPRLTAFLSSVNMQDCRPIKNTFGSNIIN